MVTLQIPTARDFWKGVALFAYRRWAGPNGTKPVGIPGNRDPEAECTGYAPRTRIPFDDWGNCQTDGHYLCAGCAHRAPPPSDDEPR